MDPANPATSQKPKKDVFSDRFQTVFGPFSVVFGPFSAVLHDLHVVFFCFLTSWRRGAAAAPSRRRRSAVAAPPRLTPRPRRRRHPATQRQH